MKTFPLLCAGLLFAATASAQPRSYKTGDKYDPTVYMISVAEIDSSSDCDGCPAMRAAERNKLAAAAAVADYRQTQRDGFQQAALPQFIFASKDNRFSFALGGSVDLRASYGFEGISDNRDFVPYDIPVPGSYATDQKFSMDASTSRIYLKAIANSRALGRVVLFVDTDFRGGDPGSYTPRLRSAYVSLLGFTLGRDVTTFCDLQAAPTTIDFRGPNAYNFNFATLLRYEVTFANDRLTFGVAAEAPAVSGTYNDNFTRLHQRMPDFPAYLQLAWGDRRDSHIRASGIVRNMYLRDVRTGENTSLMGWGAQFSGRIKVGRPLTLFMNGVYGEGITPYIQDLTGAGLDFTPNPQNPEQVQTMPMWGWQAAARIDLTRRLFVSGGYSMVRVEKHNGALADEQYRQGQYAFGNIFFSVTPRFQIAAEYLYGTRKNMDGASNHANRANLMFKYNF